MSWHRHTRFRLWEIALLGVAGGVSTLIAVALVAYVLRGL